MVRTRSGTRVAVASVLLAAAGLAVSACSTSSTKKSAANTGSETQNRPAAAVAGASNPRPLNAPKVRRGALREFRTPQQQGLFYTADDAEAKSVQRLYHFVPSGQFGYLDAMPARHTTPLYRLKLSGQAAYLLTPSPDERDRLVAHGQFQYEGTEGFIGTTAGRGMIKLWRLSYWRPGAPGHYWKVATASQMKQLAKQGWHVDGVLGYVWSSS